ncbi:MAG: glycosyltransferase family 4 protein [Pirellulaceae bacterium]
MERILLIADNLAAASPTADALPLADALQQTGRSVQVVELLANQHDNYGQDSNITRIEWPERFCWSSYRRLQDVGRLFQPDWIHAWGQHSIRAAAACHWRQKVPFVAVHSSTTRLQANYQNWFDRWAIAQADVQFGRSDTLDGIHHLPVARTDDLWSSDPSITREELCRCLNLPADAKLVGTCQPMIPATRLKDFLWAADLMTCIRDDVYWLVIGNGPQSWRLHRFVDLLQTGDQLRMLDWHPLTNEIIRHLDVYVEPSDWYDGCAGLVQAISAGIPAIGTNCPAHRKLVTHGVTGFVVECGARNEFARCVNRLINQPQIAGSFSRATTRRASTELADYSDLAELMVAAMRELRPARGVASASVAA